MKFRARSILNNPISESPGLRRYPDAVQPRNFDSASSWTKCRYSLSCLLLRLALWRDSTMWKSGGYVTSGSPTPARLQVYSVHARAHTYNTDIRARRTKRQCVCARIHTGTSRRHNHVRVYIRTNVYKMSLQMDARLFLDGFLVSNFN